MRYFEGRFNFALEIEDDKVVKSYIERIKDVLETYLTGQYSNVEALYLLRIDEISME